MRRYFVATLVTIATVWALVTIFSCDFTLIRVGYEMPTPIATPTVK